LSRTIYPSIPDPIAGSDLTPTVVALTQSIRLLTQQVNTIQNAPRLFRPFIESAFTSAGNSAQVNLTLQTQADVLILLGLTAPASVTGTGHLIVNADGNDVTVSTIAVAAGVAQPGLGALLLRSVAPGLHKFIGRAQFTSALNGLFIFAIGLAI
jgi:hypothetical protein